ncbi:uncharacterized protein SCHCODRAFT_02668289 [Schizophyllum commune H4-8]|uniref:uncharacterized protein n=1 Tax=Schizophyllum commune (strain H4-8 / FGSC 9210) TaxID=578458 RepID=UPI00215FE0F9|nr:uncharacterized protein SCHCODRAFT_02668289 [Schizophyllum commune H4-8]KAI5892902.1 hypothetical protein SCHCODRAFT_02668289 [Schizophyllum commune H4-8]
MPRHIFDDSLLKHQATYRRDGALHPPEGSRMRRYLASGQTDGSGPSNYAAAANPVQRDRVSRWGKGKSPEKARKPSLLDRIERDSPDRRRTSLDQNDDAAATRNKPGNLLSRITFDDPAEVKVERRDSLLNRIDFDASASDMEIDSEDAENGLDEGDEQPLLPVTLPPISSDPSEPPETPTAAQSSEPTFSNDPDVLKYRDVLLPMVLANLSRRNPSNPSIDKGKLAEDVKGGLNDDICRTFGKAMMAAREELQKRKEKDSEARVPHDAPRNVETPCRKKARSPPAAQRTETRTCRGLLDRDTMQDGQPQDVIHHSRTANRRLRTEHGTGRTIARPRRQRIGMRGPDTRHPRVAIADRRPLRQN